MSEDFRYPSMKQIETLYRRVIEQTGGEHGYLSRGNLEYVLDTVREVGERLPTGQALAKKAAFILFNVVVVHPFLNGNKRSAFELVRVFLRLNGHDLSVRSDETYDFLLRVGQNKASMKDVEKWVASHLTERQEK